MRTKALLLAAALSAVGVASSMAQAPVYSVNIVGYINKTLPTGLSMVANQLNATPNNSVQQLFGTPSGPVTVYKFNGVGYNQASYDPDLGWDGGGATILLPPGSGAFADNQSGAALPLTFVGEVQLVSSNPVKPGLGVYSSVIPRAGTLDQLGFPVAPANPLTIYKFNGTGYDQTSFDPDLGWSTASGLPPAVAISDAFFIDNQGNTDIPWNVSFTVGP